LKKLVGYITAAWPDREFSIDLIRAMGESGCDAVELGIPFSDPVADGPVIEEANMRSLANGFRFADALAISEAVARDLDLYWMGYFNPFWRRGLERVAKEAEELGVRGLLIPDLPFEEGEPYRELFEKRGLALIDFVAPTDTSERIEKILQRARGFVYLVAYAGITGAKKSEELASTIEAVRSVTDAPIFVGFGVNEQNAKEKARGVDGVIVGSAFIRILLDDGLTKSQKIDKIAALSARIKEEINS